MGDKVTLKIEARQVHGKKVAGLRRQGLVPAVVYGNGMTAKSVQVVAGELDKAVAAAGRHTPIHLTGNARRIAMIKQIDRHPVKHTIRHVAFHAVKADEPVVAEVPIRLVGQGESPAEKNGLVVLQAIENVAIKALPMDLPEALDVSLDGLAEAGDRIIIGDIPLPQGIEIVDNDDGREGTDDDDISVLNLTVASAYEPSALQAANETAAGQAETAEPADQPDEAPASEA